MAANVQPFSSSHLRLGNAIESAFSLPITTTIAVPSFQCLKFCRQSSAIARPDGYEIAPMA
jgi:hypothetical protein